MAAGRLEVRQKAQLQSRPTMKEFDISRRALVMGGLASLVGASFPGIARATTAIVFPAAAGNRRFSVLYGGKTIGAHTVRFSSAAGETRVNTEIQLLVKGLFGSTAFAFSHHSEEAWRAGQLISLSSETVESGETLNVEGAAIQQGFRVISKGGPFIASAATLTSNNLWTPAVLEQATVVDAQHGGIIGISAHKHPDEQIVIAGRKLGATRYTFITPYIAGTIWYDKASLWVGGEFELSGAKIQYRLDA